MTTDRGTVAAGSPDPAPGGGRSPSAFAELGAYIALPRTSRLLLSPDGERLVTAVATLDPERTTYVTALWEVDPAGVRPARRLTRSAKGETPVAFLPDGGLLFTSARPDPDSKDDDGPAALWLLPAGGGEARVVAVRPGGVQGAVVARDAGTVVLASSTLPGAEGAEDDEKRRKARKDLKVSAILHESYPSGTGTPTSGPTRCGCSPAGCPPIPRPAPTTASSAVSPCAT